MIVRCTIKWSTSVLMGWLFSAWLCCFQAFYRMTSMTGGGSKIGITLSQIRPTWQCPSPDIDPGYMSRKKFRTDPAVYMSCMSQNFRLFHVSNLIRSKLSNFSAHVYGVSVFERGPTHSGRPPGICVAVWQGTRLSPAAAGCRRGPASPW